MVPASIIPPSLSTNISSTSRMVENLCVIRIVVLPAIRALNFVNSSYSALASSEAVGSSRIRILESAMKARLMAIFCHSPSDNWVALDHSLLSLVLYCSGSCSMNRSAPACRAASCTRAKLSASSISPTAIFFSIVKGYLMKS